MSNTVAAAHVHPKTGVASRPFKGTYIRHKVSLTDVEWQTLDKIGDFLLPHLQKRGKRPSRGMVIAEMIRRVRAT